MAETSIEWTERSWNPIVGCTIVSPGCTNCYAMGMAERFRHVYRGRKWAGAAAEAMTRRVNGKAVWTGQLTLAPDHLLTEPLRRRKPTTYFVNSMGDLFHEDTPEEWIDRVFAVMALSEMLHLCPAGPDGRSKHIFQVLTKRADRMRQYVGNLPNRDDIIADAADRIMGGEFPVELLVKLKRLVRMPLPNVWLGVSAEDQKRADERVPELLATPAAIRFVSAEPLLGPIDFEDIDDGERDGVRLRFDALSGLAFDGEGAVEGVFGNPDPKLDWIIVGGESGPGARPMHPDWPRQIRDQCAAAGTAFFFKQWGNWLPLVDRDKDDPDWRLDYSRRYSDDRPDIAWLNVAGGRGFHGDRFHIMGRGMKATAGRMLDGVEHNAMPEVRRG